MFSADTILQSGGILLVALVIFAETGLLFGFIFPGDSLLLAAGLFASQGKLPIFWLILITTLSAIAGYESGYFIGQKAGPRVFKRRDGLLFKYEYVEKTQDFFSRHGGKTIILARFVPYVRTFVPVVAGVGGMNKSLYRLYNLIGATLWVGGLVLLSYWLGGTVPNFDKYVLVVVVGGLIIFHTVIFWHLLHNAERRRNFKKSLIEEWRYYLGNRKKKDS